MVIQDREGVLIHDPTVLAGSRHVCTRLQIVTIEDLFAGKKPVMPPQDPAAFIEEVLDLGAMTPIDPRVRH